jgi:hypothetical protein
MLVASSAVSHIYMFRGRIGCWSRPHGWNGATHVDAHMCVWWSFAQRLHDVARHRLERVVLFTVSIARFGAVRCVLAWCVVRVQQWGTQTARLVDGTAWRRVLGASIVGVHEVSWTVRLQAHCGAMRPVPCARYVSWILAAALLLVCAGVESRHDPPKPSARQGHTASDCAEKCASMMGEFVRHSTPTQIQDSVHSGLRLRKQLEMFCQVLPSTNISSDRPHVECCAELKYCELWMLQCSVGMWLNRAHKSVSVSSQLVDCSR